MTKPTIEQILTAKPEVHPGVYAYAIDDAAHAGLLKVGQTTREVKQRVAEQLKTATIKNFRIEIDEPAERDLAGSLLSRESKNLFNWSLRQNPATLPISEIAEDFFKHPILNS